MTARARSRRRLLGATAAVALAAAAAATDTFWPTTAAIVPDPDAAPADAAPADAPPADARPPGDTHGGPYTPGDTHGGPNIPVSQQNSHKTANPETHRRRPPVDAAVPAVEIAPPPPPDAAPPPPPPAWLTLDISPWCNARIDGADVGRANRAQPIELRPGRHEVVCSQGPGMGEWRRTVTLTPGQHLTESGTVLRPVNVGIAVSSGDGVRISGRYHANGSRLKLSPDRYRIEVIKGGQPTGGRWVTLPRVPSCVLRDRPALDCYAPKP